MLRDGHFDSETKARAVHLAASGGPASDHIEIDDARFLFTAHFKKSGSDVIPLINSVKGSFTFVAGQVAHTADMKQELAAAQALFPVYRVVQARTPQPGVAQGPQGPQQQQNTSSHFLTSNLLLYGAC